MPQIDRMEDHPVLRALLQRRSVSPRRLASPGPDAAELQMVIRAALTAPDHGRLRPWRFLHIPEEHRDRLAEAFASAARETHPDIADEAVLREAGKAHNAPCLIAVILHIEKGHAMVPEEEQWASGGAAVQNMLLAAEALGYRAMIVSGGKTRSQNLRQALGLAPEEHLLGFVSIGTATADPAPIDRPSPAERLAEWSPSRS